MNFVTDCPTHLMAISATVAMNLKERLYVIDHGHGVSCLGFDVCLGRCNRLEEWMKMAVTGNERSTHVPDEAYYKALYLRYEDLMKVAALRCEQEGIKCPTELSPQLVGLEGKRVEVVTTYGEKRRFNVSKSTGWQPIHLEIPSRRSHGGPGADREYKSVTVVKE